MEGKIRLAYLVSHPIQYQAPLLRRITQEPDIDLTVFYCSDFSTKQFLDPGFGVRVQWDVALLDGYRSHTLPAIGGTERVTFWRPWNYGLARELKAGGFHALWIHGYARWLSWAAMVTARRLGIKIMIRDEPTSISASRGPAKRMAKRGFFFGLKVMCDAFLAIGSLNREYYRLNGIRDDRIFLVPYAVDNQFFQSHAAVSAAAREGLRASLCMRPGRPVILYAGKMLKRKRASDLLEAYLRLSPDGRREPDPYLLFIGDGEMRAALEVRAAGLGWDSIKFLGFKNQMELPGYYDLGDVFVLPSVHEPWGLAVNEAMNARCAVILSDQVGCGPDLVRNGENGRIFRAGSVEDLHRALREVLWNPSDCRAMGQKSLELIDGWSFEEDVKGLKHALKAILTGGAGT